MTGLGTEARLVLRGTRAQRVAFRVLTGLGLLAAVFGPSGCDRSAKTTLRVATTTSLRDSGLQAKLIDAFKAQTNINLEVLAVGTGKAMKLGERGEVSAIITHAPSRELEFLAGNHAILRQALMENCFWLVGPKKDPAAIQGQPILKALQRIHASQSLFISRNDKSGTHRRELELWHKANLQPKGPYYLKNGQGQGPNLLMASQTQAYTLTDSATFLKMAPKLDLRPVVRDDPSLRNVYSLLLINPAKNEHIQEQAARRLLRFLTSKTARDLIQNHRIRGHQLFKLHKAD